MKSQNELLCLLYLLLNIYPFYYSTCVTKRYSGLIQVECVNISSTYAEIPEDATHILINCKMTRLLSNLTSLCRFQSLIFFSMSQCSIEKIPDNMFYNLTKLRVVHLDQLKIKSLPSNMFQNCNSFEQLHLSDLPNLAVVSPFTLGEDHKIKEISLQKLRLSSQQMWSFLTLAYQTLEVLSWTENFQKLIFTSVYFKHFNLKIVRLSRNQIDDAEFLHNTHVESINLDFNQLGYDENFLVKLDISNSTTEIRLGNNEIFGIFPPSYSRFGTNISSLSINNNKIIGFGENFPNMFPNLQFLDASFNNILRISESIKYFIKYTFLNLMENPIFCDCKMNDFMALCNNTKYRIACSVTQLQNDGDITVTKKQTFLSAASQFQCVEPRIAIWIYIRGHFAKINTNGHPAEVTIIQLYKCEYIQLKCIVKGDPLPELIIQNPNNALLSSTMFHHTDAITVSTPVLVISYTSLSNGAKNNYLKCIGMNYFGRKHQTIVFQKMAEFRPIKDNKAGIMTTYLCDRNETERLLHTHVFMLISSTLLCLCFIKNIL